MASAVAGRVGREVQIKIGRIEEKRRAGPALGIVRDGDRGDGTAAKRAGSRAGGAGEGRRQHEDGAGYDGGARRTRGGLLRRPNRPRRREFSYQRSAPELSRRIG